MTEDVVDRRGIAAELDQARLELHYLLDRAGTADFERTSMDAVDKRAALVPQGVWLHGGRATTAVGASSRPVACACCRSYAWLLNAASAPFHQINYYGSCAAARVYNRRRMAAQCDRVIARLQGKLAAEPERNFVLAMHFPVRWDPFFTDTMPLEAVYRYPTKHFDFHRRQLTLGA